MEAFPTTTTASTTTMSTTTSVAYCPPGYVQANDPRVCVKYVSEELSWVEAENGCKRESAHLVSMSQLSLHDWLIKWLATTQPEAKPVWIGLNSNCAIRWIDGEGIRYSYWDQASRPPFGYNDVSTKCVAMKPDGFWASLNCGTTKCPR